MPKTTPHSRPSSDDHGWKVRITTIGDGARPAANLLDSLPAIKGKQNADRRGSTCLPCGKRAPCRARSPVGVPRRFCPWDSRIPRCGLGPGFAALAPDGGGLPPAPTPVTASTSHAGHSAGGHDVRYRPSATGTNPLLAGTASRSRQPESPSDVLARGARGRRFYSYRAPSQAESFSMLICLIPRAFCCGSFGHECGRCGFNAFITR